MRNAYALFKCDASLDDIVSALPDIRSAVNTPSTMEISVTEGIERVKEIPGLEEVARKAKDVDFNYFIEAYDSNLSNENVANELTAVQNQSYQSPLYQDGDDYIGQVFYKKDDSPTGEIIYKD